MSGRYRFSDARSLERLGQMLDDFFQAEGAAYAWPGAVLPETARMVEMVEAGMLVQALSDGSVRRASAGLERPATGVVIAVLNTSQAVWSSDARLEVALADVAGPGPGELWLGDQGRILATKPSGTGLMQQVGIRLYYDGRIQKHHCQICPYPPVVIFVE